MNGLRWKYAKIAIFGAGKKGRELYQLLDQYRYTINCVIDNDVSKWHTNICAHGSGGEIISLEQYISEQRECEIIVSTKNKEIEGQLRENHLNYWTFYEGNRCFFSRKAVRNYIDEYLLHKFSIFSFNDNMLFCEGKENWYRIQYYNFYNENLICQMQNDEEQVLEDELYDQIYSDELFENRCGMHLVYSLINEFCEKGARIGDLGCGHGFLLDELRKLEKYILVACEGSPARCKYLKKQLYDTVQCSLEDMGAVEDSFFDAVVCMEVLEHVKNIELCVGEIRRVLKKGGYCWISVPEGAMCDCQTHVRQFTVNSLGMSFKRNKFTIENIQSIPTDYMHINGQLLMQCRKD